MDIYYKDELHKKQTFFLLEKFKQKEINQDIYYGSFSYIIAGIYKADRIAKMIDNEGVIDIDKLNDEIMFYSSTEKKMINFALQCFNNSLSDINLFDVMRFLDDENILVIKQAINIRY